MVLTEDDRRLLGRAVALWGAPQQWDMVLEECSEVITSVLHFRRGRATTDQVAEEVADALIMLEQAREMVGAARVDRIVAAKLKRLLVNVSKGEIAKEQR
jgi:hypothetical protein